MRSTGYLVVTLLFTAALTTHSLHLALLARQQNIPAPAPEIVKLLEQKIQEHHLAGMAAIVVSADRVAGIGSAGVRRDGESAQIEIHDIFHLGSNTKAITATMIARLIEAGRLSWTSTPLDVFPEMKATIHPAFQSITLEQLLAHCAGVPPYTDTDAKEFKTLPKLSGSALEQRLKFAEWVLKHDPVEKPGTKNVYSNADYAIAAAMAERAAGLSWEKLIASQVLEPLGIRAIFEWPGTSDKNQPWGHVETKKGLRPQNPADKDAMLPPFLLPAGGMAMTMSDYGRLLQKHLKGLEGKPTSFLSAETFRRLHTAPLQNNFALGWGVQLLNGIPSSVHTGSAGTFFAIVALQPGRDIGVAVVANAGGERAKAGCVEALKALLAQYSSLSL